MRIWRELLEVARWAPSSYNTQPWRLRVLSELQAELCYEPSHLLPAADPEGKLTAVALGSFTEALSIAGAPRSFEVRAALRGESPWLAAGPPAPFARLVIAQRRAPESLTASLIEARRTSRLPFDSVETDRTELVALAASVDGSGHTLGVSASPELVAQVLDLYADALIARVETDRFREEIGRWLRRSEQTALRAGDGIPPGCLGPAGPQLRRLVELSLRAALPGARGRARHAVRTSLAGTATVGWLTGPFATPDERFRAGRTLCRLWLTATAHGLYLHPLDPVVADVALTARLSEPVRGAGPWCVFRLGRGAVPARSVRLGSDELLV